MTYWLAARTAQLKKHQYELTLGYGVTGAGTDEASHPAGGDGGPCETPSSQALLEMPSPCVGLSSGNELERSGRKGNEGKSSIESPVRVDDSLGSCSGRARQDRFAILLPYPSAWTVHRMHIAAQELRLVTAH